MTTEHATACAALTSFEVALNGSFVERKDEVRCLLLALIAKKHVLLLGPPGTGKSALANAIANSLGWQLFVLLFTMTTMPEEVYGPVSLKGLENDQYRRVTAGYLPTAQLGFLDEVFKANSSILNSLLTIANERTFDNGGQRTICPLETLIGASNELPRENEGLEALYDRFMFRRWVSYVQDRGAMRKILAGGARVKAPALDRTHIETLRSIAATVDVEPILDALLDLREELAEKEIAVSDRRWVEIIDVIKASAALAGRTVARHSDLMPLVDCLWNKPEEAGVIAAAIAGKVAPGLAEANALYDAAVEVFNAAPTGKSGPDTVIALAGALQKIKGLSSDVAGLPRSPEVDEVAAKIAALGNEIKRANLRAVSDS